METKYNNEERYYQAKKQVEEIKGFYGHLATYIVLNIIFFVMNMMTSPNDLWFYWPALGWGMGVFFHAMKVFGFMPFFNKDWEERKIKELMEKEKQTKKSWE